MNVMTSKGFVRPMLAPAWTDDCNQHRLICFDLPQVLEGRLSYFLVGAWSVVYRVVQLQIQFDSSMSTSSRCAYDCNLPTNRWKRSYLRTPRKRRSPKLGSPPCLSKPLCRCMSCASADRALPTLDCGWMCSISKSQMQARQNVRYQYHDINADQCFDLPYASTIERE